MPCRKSQAKENPNFGIFMEQLMSRSRIKVFFNRAASAFLSKFSSSHLSNFNIAAAARRHDGIPAVPGSWSCKFRVPNKVAFSAPPPKHS